MKPNYEYLGDSDYLPAKAIQAMTKQGNSVKWQTIHNKCENVHKLIVKLTGYYRGCQHDRNIDYYSSKYKGKKCYYVELTSCKPRKQYIYTINNL